MGIKTKISYCDSTINPIMGCTGCSLYHSDLAKNHCYAAALVNRYAGCKGWPDKFTEPKHFPERLERALGWSDLTGTKRPSKPWLDGMPRIIFVNDMSDGFCPDVDPTVWLASYLEAMGRSPHIWLLLTKWPGNMAHFCDDWPLPDNVWPGVTVTSDDDYHRIWVLLHIAALRHWVSLEPLLDFVHFNRAHLAHPAIPNLSWVVAGGESGPNARRCRSKWARAVRNQCQAVHVPFFWKQWGEWLPFDQREAGQFRNSVSFSHNDFAWRVGKKVAGRVLDGRTWDEMPEVHHV